MEPTHIRVIKAVAGLIAVILVLYLFWPRTYLMKFDEEAYLPIGRTRELGEVRVFGLTKSSDDTIRCWLGRQLLTSSLSSVGKMSKPKSVKIVNENKGWAMELSDTLLLYDLSKKLQMARMTKEGLTLQDPFEPLELQYGSWSVTDLDTSHPPVALFWRTDTSLLAVFPHRVLLLLPHGQVKKVDINKELFNWSAAWRKEQLVLGRAGSLLVFDFNRKKKRKLSLPGDKMAPWAKVRSVAFTSDDTVALAISDPQPDRCCLYEISLTQQENKWDNVIKLPVTKDDFGFVCVPALIATNEGNLRVLCVQYTAKGGSAILFHIERSKLNGARQTNS